MAEEALRLVGADARAADGLAAAAVSLARLERDPVAECVAWRARGMATRRLEDLEQAEGFLRTAIAVGRRHGAHETAEARMSLAAVLMERGQFTAARRQARLAADALVGQAQSRARVQLAYIEQRAGSADEALRTYALALHQFHRAGDRLWEARLRNNRGILFAYQGKTGAAARDLTKAAELYEALGLPILAGEARWNLGFAASLRGDLVEALAVFEAAGTQLDRAGALPGVTFLDRCQALLSAGLVADAREAITIGLERLAVSDAASDVAEAKLLLSETLLLSGDQSAAFTCAVEAGAAFEQQGRPSFALMATLAALRATAGEAASAVWETADRTATELRAAGWGDAAAEIALLKVRRAVQSGQPVGSSSMGVVRAATGRGPIPQRMMAWHTIALLRVAQEDDAGALRALSAGLRLHDRHRATLSALELQVHTASRAAELAQTGLALALKGRPGSVLLWSERWRAGSLLVRPVKPPKDHVLAASLTDLRAVSAELQQARLNGDGFGHLQRRQRWLEHRVTDRARSLHTEVVQVAAASLQGLHAALDHRALVEYVESDAQLYAVVAAGGRSSVHPLGGIAPVADELEMMRFALGRLATGASQRMAIANRRSLDSSASRLDAALLLPLRARIGDRSIVMVPTGRLHVLPWGLLKTTADRAVSVAPSASVWLATRDRRRVSRGRVTLVAGPGLPGAQEEVEAVAVVYGDRADVLMSREASVQAVTTSLTGSSAAHIAAHGNFRSDNPLFSSLEMSDGPLTVYDMESIRPAPALVVLSACDSGISSVLPGDEVMGLVAALLRIGTRTLIASVAPIPDDVARDALVGFHRALVSGAPPADALLHARRALGPAAQVAAAALVCFGSG